MISMVDKIIRLGLKDCEGHRKRMEEELRANQEEFRNAPEILPFEREWINAYLS